MTAGRLDAAAVRSAVKLADVLRALGVKLRSRGRADCPLCEGRSTGTLAYTAEVFHCHRCHAGGDIFALVMEHAGCDFREALSAVAEIAGIRPVPGGGVSRRQIEKGKRERKRLEAATSQLERIERNVRVELAGRLRDLETARRSAGQRLGVLYRGSPERFPRETEATEGVLGALPDLTRRLVASHAIVAFAGIGDRARFLLKPGERGPLVNAVLGTGYVRDSQNRIVEVQL